MNIQGKKSIFIGACCLRDKNLLYYIILLKMYIVMHQMREAFRNAACVKSKLGRVHLQQPQILYISALGKQS